MSNKLFRKGLVVAALTGIVAGAVAGTPAYAANELTLAPTAGTSYNTFVTDTFSLSTSFASGVTPSSYAQLKYQITTDGVATVQAASQSSDTTAHATTAAAASITDVATTSNVGYVTQDVSTTSPNVRGATSVNVLLLKVKNAAYNTASTSVKVVAFIDANNNGTYESATDTWAAAQTVNFKKYSEVTTTPVITAPKEGDSAISAKVSFDGLNNEQIIAAGVTNITGDIRVGGSTTGVTANTTTANTAGTVATVSAALSTNLANGALVYVGATYKGQTVGTAATATASKKVVSTVTASLVADANAAGTAVRTDKPFVVKAVLKDADGNVVAGANVTATVSTNATLAALDTADTTKQLTVAGTAYTDAAKLPGQTGYDALSLTSDASGVVTVAFASHNYAVNNTVSVVFASQNVTASTLVVTETAAAYSLFVTNANAGQVQTVDGTAASVAVKVVDQYGATIADGYGVRAAWASSSQTTAATSASGTFADLASGVATLSILDNGTGAGTNVYNLTVEKKSVTGGYDGTNVATGANSVGSVSIIVNATAVPAAATIALTDNAFAQDSTTKVWSNATAAALNLNDYKAVDGRFSSATAPTVAGGLVLSGTVKTAVTASTAAALIPGVQVTLAGKGLEFKTTIDGRAVYTLDSATVYTDASGAYAVTAYSNLTGKQTVTITAGAATATVTAKYAAAAGNTGKTLVITAADSVVPGQNLQFTATLTDKYGNPVNTATATAANSFKFSGTGVGNIGSAVTATGDDGIATLAVSTGSADNGTITLTAVYSTDGTTANTTTVTKTVKVAPITAATVSAVAGAAQAQTGSAVSVTVTAKDAAGAAVKGAVIAFTSTGAGYLSAATATTDANGVATVKLIGNVAGANVVTATSNGASATANVTFGNSDASLSVAGHRVTAAWSYAAGKKVVITRDGKRIKSVVASDDAADSFSFNVSKKGTHKVTVSVAGVVTDVITVK